MKTKTLSRIERLARPLTPIFPSNLIVDAYSRGRLKFLEALNDEIPKNEYVPPKSLGRELWGIKFRSPIMNAAGMFKNGDCYEMVAKQGAGAYLGGTGTWNSRVGNEKEGIYLPFVPYSKSHSASNWLGLPNDGDKINSQRVKQFEKIESCPIGWSVMASPDLHDDEKLKYLVKGMKLYEQAGVDFLEINESCPNTEQKNLQDGGLANRLRYVKKYFLDQRERKIPVIVKFSNDTEVEQIPEILDLLFENGFDGVNFGNTSIAYEQIKTFIHGTDESLYDYFTKKFGGGVSGRPLKDLSLNLGIHAVDYLETRPPSQEFHVIRTGGIETEEDVQESERAGISISQWYTGYFESFAKNGQDIYRKLFE